MVAQVEHAGETATGIKLLTPQPVGLLMVGQPGNAPPLGEQVIVTMSNEEADGFLGVVGYGEAADFEVAEAEGAAGFKDIPADLMFQAGLQRQGSGPVGE